MSLDTFPEVSDRDAGVAPAERSEASRGGPEDFERSRHVCAGLVLECHGKLDEPLNKRTILTLQFQPETLEDLVRLEEPPFIKEPDELEESRVLVPCLAPPWFRGHLHD